MSHIVERKKRSIYLYLVLGLVLFYVCHWLQSVYAQAPAVDVLEDPFEIGKVNWVLANMGKQPYLNLHFTDNSVLAGSIGAVIAFWLYLRPKVVGIFRPGEEHGSARFATKEELIGLRDKEEDNNMIFSQNAQMGLFNKQLPIEKQINKNVLTIGGTGDWKTRSGVKPNALQRNSSYLFTDTKGLLVHEMGQSFEKDGYQVKIFDVITFLNSNRFNPYHYMRSEMDIDRLAKQVVEALEDNSENKGEQFWEDCKLFFMRCLIGYLYFDSQVSNYTASLPQITDMLRNMERVDPDVPSPVEMMFEDLESQLPGNYANKHWELYQNNFRNETKYSVFAMVATAFSVFDHNQVRQLVSEDNMEMETWNIKKTAVFVNIPEVDPSYRFLTALFFGTVFSVTFKTADDILLGRRTDYTYPLHLQVYADEFAQIGKIPHLPALISVIRSREISIKIMVQSMSQVEKLYGDKDTKTILNNCGTIVYLGTNDQDTLKWLSARSGASTINDRNVSEGSGSYGSSSTQNSKLQRMLLTEHEIATIPVDEALVFINRHNVFQDKKYRLEEHKRYHELAENPSDPTWYRYRRYMSDIEEFQAHIRPSHMIEVSAEEVLNVPLGA